MGFWIAIAVLAPVLAPHRPNAIVGKLNQAPSLVHLMGTDNLGRDVLSRLMFGSQPILTLAPLAVLCASIVGITLGLVAGYFGGILDDVLMRLLDATMAFPTLLLYMIIIAAVGPSRLNVILAITVGGFPGVARLVRSLVLDVRNREYVHAARLRGESALYIMFREILPNCLGPVIIDACLRVPRVANFPKVGNPGPRRGGGELCETRQPGPQVGDNGVTIYCHRPLAELARSRPVIHAPKKQPFSVDHRFMLQAGQ